MTNSIERVTSSLENAEATISFEKQGVNADLTDQEWNELTNRTKLKTADNEAVSEKIMLKNNNTFEVQVHDVLLQGITGDEAAVVEDEDKLFIDFMNKGKGLISSSDMASIKGMCNGMLKGRIVEDSKGKREFQFVQIYSDGTCSSIMRTKQEGLIQYVAYRSREEKGNENLKELHKSRDYKRAMAYKDNLIQEYYASLRRPEPLDIDSIIVDLFMAMPSLPLKSNVVPELTPESLYWRLQNVLEYGGTIGFCYMPFLAKTEKYYRLTEMDLEGFSKGFAAESISISANEIKKKLYEGGFLYLTDSSRGYETKVRYSDTNSGIKNCSDWFYCVYRLQYIKDSLKLSD